MRLRLRMMYMWALATASCGAQADEASPRIEGPARDRNVVECRYVKIPGSHIKRTVCLEHWRWQDEKRRGMAIVEMLDNAYKFRRIPTGSAL